MGRFALLLASLLTLQGAPQGPYPSAADLAAALSGVRLVEPRYTGGFDYAPCIQVMVPSRPILTAQCSSYPESGSWAASALDELTEQLERGFGRRRPLPVARAKALMNALLGASRSQGKFQNRLFARSIDQLAVLLRSRPHDTGLLNDLAVTWYLRAEATAEPADLAQALDFVEQAYALSPQVVEIRFNRALILDRLGLVFLAHEAWLEVEKGEAGTGWAQEARAMLDRLEQRSLQEQWKEARPLLERAALAGDQLQVERLVQLDLQAARRFALDDLLGEWADRVLAGGSIIATRELRVSEAVGAAIQTLSGEGSALEAAAYLGETIQGSNGSTILSRLAKGHRAYRDAQRYLEGLRTSEALEQFTAAERLLEGTKDPVGFWARCGRARALAYAGRLSQAEFLLQGLLADGRTRRYPALQAWVEWGLGWIAGRMGHLDRAFGHLRPAFQSYSQIREGENAAFLGVMLADASSILGRQREAWQFRLKALSVFREQPLSPRRHTLLMEATRAEERESRDWSSLALQTDNLRAAESRGDETWLAEAHWSRARALRHVGRIEEGLEELTRARLSAFEAPPGAPREKLIADLLLAEGEAFVTRDPRLAFADFDAAIRGYRGLGAVLDGAVATLLRAEAALRTDRSIEAEEGLASAIGDFEKVARHAGTSDLRLSYSEGVQRAYDAMILLQANARARPLEALDYLERAREIAFGSPTAGPPVTAANGWRSGRGFPARGSVVAYAVLEDRLLRWTIAGGMVALEEKKVSRREVAELVDSFADAVRRRGPEGVDAALQAAVGDLILPASGIADLQEGEPITFVPDRDLFRLPFAALASRRDRKPLIFKNPVVVSLSVRLGNPKAGVGDPLPRFFTALLVGNPALEGSQAATLPPLPGAEAEVARLAGLLGPERAVRLTGGEATQSKVLAEISRHELFVFAGHSMSDSDLPSRSHLLLTPSTAADLGSLAAGELEGRDLGKLRLVVLSSCSSLGSRSSRSAGIAGIARPFAEARGINVLGTLWPISDRGSADFLADFLSGLERGQDPRTALWQAQRMAARRERSWPRSNWLDHELIVPNL